MVDNRSNVLEIIRLVRGCVIEPLLNLGSNVLTPNLFHRQIPPQSLQHSIAHPGARIWVTLATPVATGGGGGSGGGGGVEAPHVRRASSPVSTRLI